MMRMTIAVLLLVVATSIWAEGFDRPSVIAPEAEKAEPMPRFLLISGPGRPAADCPYAERHSDEPVVCRIMLPIQGAVVCRRLGDDDTWMCTGRAIIPGSASEPQGLDL